MNLTKLAIIETKAKLTTYLGCMNLSSKDAYTASRAKLDKLIIENHSHKSLRTQLRFMDKVTNFMESASYTKVFPVHEYIKANAKLINDSTEAYRTIWGWIEAQAAYQKKCPKRLSNLAVHVDEVKEVSLATSVLKGYAVGNYVGRVMPDLVQGRYYGYLLNVSSFITFEADSLEELKKEFTWAMSQTPIEQEDAYVQPLFAYLSKGDSQFLAHINHSDARFFSVSQNHDEYATFCTAQRLLEGQRTQTDHVLYSKSEVLNHIKHFI